MWRLILVAAAVAYNCRVESTKQFMRNLTLGITANRGGIDLFYLDKDGNSPLTHLIQYSTEENVLEILRETKFEYTLRNKKTPIMLAVINNMPYVASYIAEHVSVDYLNNSNGFLNKVDGDNFTVFEYICMRSNRDDFIDVMRYPHELYHMGEYFNNYPSWWDQNREADLYASNMGDYFAYFTTSTRLAYTTVVEFTNGTILAEILTKYQRPGRICDGTLQSNATLIVQGCDYSCVDDDHEWCYYVNGTTPFSDISISEMVSYELRLVASPWIVGSRHKPEQRISWLLCCHKYPIEYQDPRRVNDNYATPPCRHYI
jgi:hypothetical protein